MRVQNALRLPGGAARVAHGRRRVLVELVELERRIAARDQLLVVERTVALSGTVGHHDLALGRLERRHRLGKRAVDEHDPIVRVGRDVAQVLLEETHVQRVEDRAHRRHGEIELEMADRVPGEGRDAIPRLDPQLGEGAGEPAGALDDLRVGGPLDAGLGPRHELALPEDGRGTLRDLLDEQRAVHHQPVHRRSLRGGWRPNRGRERRR